MDSGVTDNGSALVLVDDARLFFAYSRVRRERNNPRVQGRAPQGAIEITKNWCWRPVYADECRVF